MIEVEDKTKIEKPETLEDVKDYLEKFSDQVAKALKALSDNDQKILAQVKEALEEVLKQVLKVDRKLNLLTDIFELTMIGEGELKRMTRDEYRELIEKLR